MFHMYSHIYLISPEKNSHHFADDILKHIFMSEKFGILISISLTFLYLKVQLTINQHCCTDNGLAQNRRQAITWSNTDPVHWRIFVALGGDELTESAPMTHV